MAGTSTSSSFSTSGLQAVSQAAEQFMQEQYNWGLQQFNLNSQLTDQVVGDLLNQYSQLTGLGNNLMGMYQQYFQPEYHNLINDANNYASVARIQQAMGAAESNVAQNFNGQRNAALADLQSYGIDPSSGRYAQLDQAERVQEAAAAAGAGFQAEQSTEATGRALRSEALQLGSVMPSQATAAYNAASQAATAGENAKLANTQEGVNALNSAVPWANVAQQLKTAASNSQSNNQPNNSSANKSAQGPSSTSPSSTSDTTGQHVNTSAGPAASNAASNAVDPSASIQPFPQSPSQTAQNTGTFPAPDNMDPWGTNVSNDPIANSDPSNNAFNWTNSTTGDTGNTQYDPNLWDSVSSDTSSASSSDAPSYDDTGYAEGGPIKTQGHRGVVPMDKSPSRGREVDDVPGVVNGSNEPVRLNAGERIVDRKTTEWYGHKFFEDLKRKAEKARAAQTAKPSMKPALPSQRPSRGVVHV